MMRRIFAVGVIAVALSGCASARSNSVAVVRKYSSPPAEGQWGLVADTRDFWQDVEVLYAASDAGDADAIHTILVIGTFTDGAVSEGMPDLSEVVKKHPGIARKLIAGNDRLERRYAHWIQ